MKKQSKLFRDGENMMKTYHMAKDALRNGLGPAHNSDKTFGAVLGKVENEAYYVIIVEKGENGNRSKPVDWYGWSPKSNFASGFGGWYKYDYDEFIKENPWVKEAWDFPNK